MNTDARYKLRVTLKSGALIILNNMLHKSCEEVLDYWQDYMSVGNPGMGFIVNDNGVTAWLYSEVASVVYAEEET